MPLPRQQAALVPRKQGLLPLLTTLISRQVAVQAGAAGIGRQVAVQAGATGAQLGLGHSRPPRRTVLLPRQVELAPRVVTLHPNNSRANNPQGSSMEEPNPKWVINMSSKHLTQVQRSVLAKGPNFVVSPRHPPNLEYISAIESAYTKLCQWDAEELGVDIN